MLTELLKKYWGYKEFREHQRSIIESVLAGRNTVVILPTGGGKSLCYQLPATCLEGLVIVVSPLIALMKSQVDSLQEKGISAVFLNSTLTKKRIQEIKQNIVKGGLKILYVAPETLNKEEMVSFLKKVPLSFIAIDEAHCISDWGHDFRPEYRKLKQTMEALGPLPTMALTATATPQVQKDIIHNLGMKDANVFISSFDRPNLYYQVVPKVQVEKKLVQFIKKQPNPIGIVYCQSRKKAEELSGFLQQNNIVATPYHAGLDHTIRVKNQNAFLANEKKVIVATIAFGMGIDKPDVGFIVHYDAPRSLEGYYQETGRAGRNGEPANCILFYDPEDLTKFEKFNNGKPVTQEKKLAILLKEVDAYAVTSVCRRRQILHYFGEEYQGDCKRCDNCEKEQASYEGKALVLQALEAVQATHEQHPADYIAKLLSGDETPDVVNNNDHNLPIFGKGKEYATLWDSIIRQTILHGYLARDTEEVAILKITPKGLSFLENPCSVLFYRDHVYNFQEKGGDDEKVSVVDTLLLEQLTHLRNQEATKKKIKPYLVFQESMLEQMAIYYPTSVQALTTIPGISLGKAQKFGPPFVKMIVAHVEKHDIEPLIKVVTNLNRPKFATRAHIVQQIDRKIPLERIAKARKITFQELITELELLCATGIQVDLRYHINQILSDEDQETLYDYFYDMAEDDIELACRELAGDYDEEQIRLMRIRFFAKVAK